MKVALSKFELQVSDALKEIEKHLIAKNRLYGDSALEPIRVFSDVDVEEQIKVRIDDQLSRLINGVNEGSVDDLIGHLLLLKIAKGQ